MPDRAGIDDAFKALSCAQRRALLRLVAERTAAPDRCCGDAEVCACQLAEALALAPSTISHHMNVLVGAGLVSARREGLWVYYRVERGALARLARELQMM